MIISMEIKAYEIITSTSYESRNEDITHDSLLESEKSLLYLSEVFYLVSQINLITDKIHKKIIGNRNRSWRFRSILTLYRTIEKKSGTFLHFCKTKHGFEI